MWIIYILILILMLGLLVLVHEFGHFIVAKKCGVHIYEFSIGMGPLLFKHIGKDKIQYSIRALPIGGYVQMAGEVMEDDEDLKDKDTFMCNKKWYQRVLILVAGVFNNFLIAFILLFMYGLIWGCPTSTPKVTSVQEQSAYEEAGGRSGDLITKVNGKKVTTTDRLQILLILKSDNDTYEIEVQREDGQTETLYVTPKTEKDEDGNESKVFGIAMQHDQEKGFIAAIKFAGRKFTTIYQSMFTIIGGIFTGKVSLNSLSGPVGMYSVVEQSVSDQSISYAIANIIYLTAYISINLGFMNILPFPAFDGGHVLFIIIEFLRGGKPINKEIEGWAHMIGFAFLMLLSIIIAIKDVINLF